ncbi:hypothetical protein MGR01S_05830 [Meiothermus granaticius NBRC 107808]|nr:hypothetical protein MGR01S_05830 [Meiothermus granaticius NBRC 107808]
MGKDHLGAILGLTADHHEGQLVLLGELVQLGKLGLADGAPTGPEGDDQWFALEAGEGIAFPSGISQAISATAQAAVLVVVRIARAHRVQVAYDPNYRPRLRAERGGLEAARAALAEVLPYTDLLLPGFPADPEVLGLTSETPRRALERCKLETPVARLEGDDGAYLRTQASPKSRPRPHRASWTPRGRRPSWPTAARSRPAAASPPGFPRQRRKAMPVRPCAPLPVCPRSRRPWL